MIYWCLREDTVAWIGLQDCKTQVNQASASFSAFASAFASALSFFPFPFFSTLTDKVQTKSRPYITHHYTAFVLLFILGRIANHPGVDHLRAVGHNLQKHFSCWAPHNILTIKPKHRVVQCNKMRDRSLNSPVLSGSCSPTPARRAWQGNPSPDQTILWLNY